MAILLDFASISSICSFGSNPLIFPIVVTISSLDKEILPSPINKDVMSETLKSPFREGIALGGRGVVLKVKLKPFPSRGRDVSYLTSPAQIPACGTIAPGSSRVFASVIRLLCLLRYSLQGGSHQ